MLNNMSESFNNFFSANISFDSSCDLRFPTRALNSAGNLLMAPARHLLGGKTVCCIQIPTGKDTSRALFCQVDDSQSHGFKRFVKTILSIVFIFSAVVGAGTKGLAFLFSPTLREFYTKFKAAEKEKRTQGNKEISTFNDPSFRIQNDAVYHLYKKDFVELRNTLKKYNSSELQTFARRISSSEYSVFLEEYPHLNPSVKKTKGSLHYMFGCFLKAFVEGEIKTEEFLDKLKKLDSFMEREMNENEDPQFTQASVEFARNREQDGAFDKFVTIAFQIVRTHLILAEILPLPV